MKAKVVYLTDVKPHVEAYVYNVCEGVWYVYIDFYERYMSEGVGKGAGITSLYFGTEEEILFEVQIKFPDGLLFGSVSKKTYHGTFYTYKAYESIVK